MSRYSHPQIQVAKISQSIYDNFEKLNALFSCKFPFWNLDQKFWKSAVDAKYVEGENRIAIGQIIKLKTADESHGLTRCYIAGLLCINKHYARVLALYFISSTKRAIAKFMHICNYEFQANGRRRINAGLMLAQRRRRWVSIKPTLVQRHILAGIDTTFYNVNMQ